MKINDYLLINDLNILFERPLMLYKVRKDLKILLEKGGISYQETDNLAAQGVNLVVEDGKIGEHMPEQDGYVFTSYGVKMAIMKNRKDRRFSREFGEELLSDRKRWQYSDRKWYVNSLVARTLRKFPEVMVCTGGKVGSTTMVNSLKKAGIHSIQVEQFFFTEAQIDVGTIEDWSYCLDRIRKKGTKIITLVRDPIARGISAFMSVFNAYIMDSDQSVQEQVLEFIEAASITNYVFSHWYHVEFEKALGIDVHQYPFDREKGYGFIKENNFDILLLTLERLNDNVEVIRQFLDAPDFEIITFRVGAEQEYKYIYEDIIKNLKIPYEIIERYYVNNSKMEHFYTEEDIETFRKKWEQFSIK